MARRLPQTGAIIASLHETPVCEATTTLDQVVASLGLAPLSSEDEEMVRTGFGTAIGRWWLSNPDMPRVTAVKSALESIAVCLELAERILLRSGFQTERDIQAINLVQSILGGDYLGDFCQQLRRVTKTCHAAAKACEAIPGKPGPDQFEWYADFTRVLKIIAEKNGIKATVINRSGPIAGGRFVVLAEAFEQLLPPGMRTQPSGRGQRLKRALRILRSK